MSDALNERADSSRAASPDLQPLSARQATILWEAVAPLLHDMEATGQALPDIRKLGRGSTQAALAVGLAPYAICGLLLVIFAVGYLAGWPGTCARGQAGRKPWSGWCWCRLTPSSPS